jgi:hypothetical protein
MQSGQPGSYTVGNNSLLLQEQMKLQHEELHSYPSSVIMYTALPSQLPHTLLQGKCLNVKWNETVSWSCSLRQACGCILYRKECLQKDSGGTLSLLEALSWFSYGGNSGKTQVACQDNQSLSQNSNWVPPTYKE